MPLLCDLIDLPTSPLIAITGAGGKTSTMYSLASELAQRGKRVITTTTTQIFYPEPGETDTLIIASETHVGDVLSPAVIARLITSEQGALKHIPETAKAYLLITHASMPPKAALYELIYAMQSSTRIVGVLSSDGPGEWFVNE
jgi:hypothetical protein